MEICVFANSVSTNTLNKLLEMQRESRIILEWSEERLPPWHSMRKAISLASRDYVWLLGDDDRVILENFKNLISKVNELKKKHTKPDLILLTGWSEKDNGCRESLTPLPLLHLQQFSRPTDILNILIDDLHTMNNGRFIVSKELTNIWKIQPDTIYETIHEEYRALYESVPMYLSENQDIKIYGHEEPIVILGDIKKSWSAQYFKAVFGELIMINRLSNVFEPAKGDQFSKHLAKRTSFKYLLAIRMLANQQVQIPEALNLSLIQKMKLFVSNRVPVSLLKAVHYLFYK